MCLTEVQMLNDKFKRVLKETTVDPENCDLQGLLCLIKQAHENAECFLVEQGDSSSQSCFSSECHKSEGNSVLTPLQNYYQQSNVAAEVFRSPLNIAKENSVGNYHTKHKTGSRKFRLAKPISKSKKFQFLLENLRQIIKYQNKIESLQLPSTFHQMTDLQSQIGHQFYPQAPNDHFANLQSPSPTEQKQSIRLLFEECRRLESSFKNYEVPSSQNDGQNQSQNTDKKSLLTEMIKASQIVSDMDDFQQFDQEAAKVDQRRTQSVSGFKDRARSDKKLLKEIDFSGYCISTVKGGRKKEKKTGVSNCGQCSQCRIF